ncbi:hypothetical protein GGR55DRAFT_134862 [Xylaria sp. FL0064]|nr:hypothetical protein GGR55DRAFT_134862 [Xylaria sp. FL0064]
MLMDGQYDGICRYWQSIVNRRCHLRKYRFALGCCAPALTIARASSVANHRTIPFSTPSILFFSFPECVTILFIDLRYDAIRTRGIITRFQI